LVKIELRETYLDAKLLLTRTMPTLHPLYIELAIKLFMADPLSLSFEGMPPLGDDRALDESPFPVANGANSTIFESFALSRRLPDPSYMSSISL
jgi:hypothetical protein